MQTDGHTLPSPDFKSAITLRDDWPQTYAFNFLPLEYVDVTRLPATLGQDILEMAGKSHAAAGHLNKYLLEEFDLIGKWITGFETALTRALALMPTSLFIDTIRFLGLCCAGQTIRNLMTPGDIRQCKNQIGTPEFDFVITKSPLIAPQQILPNADMPMDAMTPVNILASGAAIMGCAIAPAPDALQRRLELKLPKDITLEATGIDLSARVANGVVKRVIREVAPQWHSA
ncbi:Yop proteins translocation protein K [Thalassospira sp. MA62]|nr:Yop proteins translocation protein K [Thalassospira sp. MA62]